MFFAITTTFAGVSYYLLLDAVCLTRHAAWNLAALCGSRGLRRGRPDGLCLDVSQACFSFRPASHVSSSLAIHSFASYSDLKPWMSSIAPSGHFAATHH